MTIRHCDIRIATVGDCDVSCGSAVRDPENVGQGGGRESKTLIIFPPTPTVIPYSPGLERHADCRTAEQSRAAIPLPSLRSRSFVVLSPKKAISCMNSAGPDLLIAVLHRVNPSMSLSERADLIVDALLLNGADLRKQPALDEMKLLLLRVVRFGLPTNSHNPMPVKP